MSSEEDNGSDVLVDELPTVNRQVRRTSLAADVADKPDGSGGGRLSGVLFISVSSCRYVFSNMEF